MDKTTLLEQKIHQLIDQFVQLKREHSRLKEEAEVLKSHVGMLTHENTKAQKILAEYEQLKRAQEQATHKVERALQKLNSLGQTTTTH